MNKKLTRRQLLASAGVSAISSGIPVVSMAAAAMQPDQIQRRQAS